ncbi:MAG TPA: HAMP domain-containing sensor histidine kinase [Aggregatilineales bacterium]|nr:HAMP domain-containing histidine kinase [Anaerolineales bacterium]HRE48378.1 HAMP domain-containing sensor histidine kinase [Aggregatilineales bacterium]
MSDQSHDALGKARAIIASLRGTSENTPDHLSDSLTKVDALLAAVGDELNVLRGGLDAFKVDTAKLNSVMVHEIRKPMTSIRGYTDLLSKTAGEALNDMQKGFIDTIKSNIIALEGLVTNISDFGKLKNGVLKLSPKPTPFLMVSMDIKKGAGALADQFGHTLTVESGPDLPELALDTMWLSKAILHLVRNAAMYTPKGGQIKITFMPTESGGITISVIDSGIGMKPEDSARMGEPFFRADHSLVTSQKGYGLSIPVVCGLLALMGSTLEVDSTLEAGSTFRFTLHNPA